jgi:hypothetical protein
MTLLILLTFATATNLLQGQLMWINHRDYPGGPYAYFLSTTDSWFETLGTATDVVANIMADALLVYRCYVVWSGSFWILVPLGLLYLTSITFSLLTTLQSALLNDTFLANSTNFYIPWISLTSGLNFIVTGLIVFRILSISHQSRGKIATEAHQVYTSAAAILIESALPFSILGIVFAVESAKNEPPQEALAFIWGIFFAISPQLIILRVAMGRAWSEDTQTKMKQTTTMVFKNPLDKETSGQNNFQDYDLPSNGDVTFERSSNNTLIIAGPTEV